MNKLGVTPEVGMSKRRLVFDIKMYAKVKAIWGRPYRCPSGNCWDEADLEKGIWLPRKGDGMIQHWVSWQL